jgi:phage terminase large subunit-like protein
MKDLEGLAERATRMPSSEPSFRNLNLNQRVVSVAPFVSRSVWESTGAPPDLSVFQEFPVYAGLDLSARTDLTALVLIAFDGAIWHCLPYFWTPKLGLRERSARDRAPYDVWADQGHINTTPGASIDYEFVVADVMEIIAGMNIAAIGFDRWRIDIMRKEFERAGADVPLVEFGQGFKDMSPALDALESVLLNGNIRHGMNPVLTMCAANASVDSDAAGNRKFTKQKSTGRIDGMVALAMALGMTCAKEPESHAHEQVVFDLNAA